jgi:excisionase family DNA binding protein
MSTHRRDGPRITKAEIARAFKEGAREALPPILSPQLLAESLGLPRKTIYLWIETGRLDGCFRKRGKHVLIWRDRVIDEILNGKDW